MAQLAPYEEGTLTAVKEILAAPVQGRDVTAYAGRTGALEWALAETLKLVEQLTEHA